MRKLVKYVASDGKEFLSESDCTAYENALILSSANYSAADEVYYFNTTDNLIKKTYVSSVSIDPVDGIVYTVCGLNEPIKQSYLYADVTSLVTEFLNNIDFTNAKTHDATINTVTVTYTVPVTPVTPPDTDENKDGSLEEIPTGDTSQEIPETEEPEQSEFTEDEGSKATPEVTESTTETEGSNSSETLSDAETE